MATTILAVLSLFVGLNVLFSDTPGDIKLFLGVLPIIAGIMLLLGYT